MKLSNLMIASLGAVALMGCDDGDKTPSETLPVDTVYSIENTVWDIKNVGTTASLSTTADADIAVVADDIIAYHFDSDSDTVKIYETTYYTVGDYSIVGDETDTDVGEISFEFGSQTVTCDFNSSNTLSLSNCTAASFDISGAAGFDPDSDEAEALVGDIEEKPGTGAEGKSVLIQDSSTATAGQLSYKLDGELSTGKLSFNVLFNGTEDQTFYATLYDATGKTDASAVDIALKKSGAIQVREYNGIDDWVLVTLSDVEFTPNEWVNFAITWDANTSEFNLTVGEQNLGAFDFNNASVNVASVAFKIGTNGNTTNSEFPVYVDDFNIYSDITGETVVLEENFDDYDTGYAFDAEDSKFTSTEATVSDAQNATQDDDSEPTDPEGVTDDFESYTAGTQIDVANSIYAAGADGTTKVAEVSIEQASSGANSLKLLDNATDGKPTVAREFANGAAESGSVSAKVYIPDTNAKSTYLFLGTSDTGSSSKRFTEILFGSKIQFRNDAAASVDLAEYTRGSWVDVTVAWDVKNADGKYPITVTIDGTAYSEIEGVEMLAEADTGAPTMMTLYVGDTTSTGNYVYFDDIDSELF